MKAFSAPAWDVDRPANALYEQFSEGQKCSRNNQKAKKNKLSAVLGKKKFSNKTSKLEINADKIGKLHRAKKRRRKGNDNRDKEDKMSCIAPPMCNEKYATKNCKSERKKKTFSKDIKHSKVFETNSCDAYLNLNQLDKKNDSKRIYKTKNKTRVQLLGTVSDALSKSSKKSKPKFSSVIKLSSATGGSKQNISGKIQSQVDKSELSATSPIHKRKRKLFQMGSFEEGNKQIKKKLKVDENDNNYFINTHNKHLNPEDKQKHSPMKVRLHNVINRKNVEQEKFANKKAKKDRKLKHVKVSQTKVTSNTNLIGDKSKQANQMQKSAKSSKNKRNARQSYLSLRERMMTQLKASRFRYINEQLYTSNSEDTKKLFENDPDSFYKYHEGYKQQVELWPLNPVERIIKAIKRKPSNLVIADFGCGDATLAKSVPNKVHSFDLVALSEEVTVCDIANTPLENATIDVVVFCLSLMGTNLSKYLIEANRVLKDGGVLKIAEVASRFDDVDVFIKNLNKYGFSIVNKDFSHNLFYFMNFTKTSGIKKTKDLPDLNLKPCWYKKR